MASSTIDRLYSIANGIGKISRYNWPINKKDSPNPIMPIKVCPDIILADNRTARLITLELNDSNSIPINNGDNGKGTPWGKNRSKNLTLLYARPIAILATNTELLIAKLFINWLVTANVYGKAPIKLANSINRNIGKNITLR